MKTYFATRTGAAEENAFLKLIGEYSGYQDDGVLVDDEGLTCVLEFVIVEEHLVSINVVERTPEYPEVERTPLHNTIHWHILSDGTPQLQGSMWDYAEEVEYCILQDRTREKWKNL